MMGKTISRYRIIEKLRGGAMGVVYKAEKTKLHRSVAVNFLPEGLSSDYARAEVVKTTPLTVTREWNKAGACLYREHSHAARAGRS